MAHSLRHSIAYICPSTRGLLHTNRLTYPLQAPTHHEQLEEMVNIATCIFEKISFLFTPEPYPMMTKNFAHFFSMTFKFPDFTEEEIHNRLLLEVRKKYK